MSAEATKPDRVAQATEAVARHAYGRLLSWLAWQWRDLAAAEDALGDALVAALATWPRDGVPDSPEGWLMTAAKRNLLKRARHRALTEDPAVTTLLVDAEATAPSAAALPDGRLRLLFVCAHPAIDAPVRSALMLQTVLGVDAARIAHACLVAPEAMTKRLVRAKAKIKANGLRFEEPDPRELAERLGSVLEAIYGAYTLDWDVDSGSSGAGEAAPPNETLAAEALYLAELVARLLPEEPEALGLLALLDLVESRRHARNDADGLLVPWHEQDVSAWDGERIGRARLLLERAASLGRLGPFQLEAAIQLAHATRFDGKPTPWDDIACLYDGLLALHPSTGARIGSALASAYAADDPALGLQRLDAVAPSQRARSQSWWAAQAHLLAWAGQPDAATAAFERAIALSKSGALRRTLVARQRALQDRDH